MQTGGFPHRGGHDPFDDHAFFSLPEHHPELDLLLAEILVFGEEEKIVGNHGEFGLFDIHQPVFFIRGDDDFAAADEDVGGRQAAEDPARDAETVAHVVPPGDHHQPVFGMGRVAQVADDACGHGFVPQGLDAMKAVRRNRPVLAVIAENCLGHRLLVGIVKIHLRHLPLLFRRQFRRRLGPHRRDQALLGVEAEHRNPQIPGEFEQFPVIVEIHAPGFVPARFFEKLLFRKLPGAPAVENRLLGGDEHLHAEGDLPWMALGQSTQQRHLLAV